MQTLRIQPGGLVVGIDDTREAETALDWAVEQAHLTHDSLTLVHAIGNQVGAWVSTGTDAMVPLGPISRAGRDLLERMCAHVADRDPTIPVTPLLRHTGPQAALASAAVEARAIVIGTHHRRAHRTGVLDPIERLLRHGALCPVTEVGPSTTLGRPKILVVVDGTTSARRLLEFAFRRAALTGLPLSVAVVPIGAAAGHLLDLCPAGFEGNLIRLICDGYRARFPELSYEVQSQPAVVQDALSLGRTRFREMILDEHHLALVEHELYGHSSPMDAVETTTVMPNAEFDREAVLVESAAPMPQSLADRQLALLMKDLAGLEPEAFLGRSPTDESTPSLEPARLPRHRRPWAASEGSEPQAGSH